MTSARLAHQPAVTADADANEADRLAQQLAALSVRLADRYRADIPNPKRREHAIRLANAASLAAQRCADYLGRAANTASGGKHPPNGVDPDAPDQCYGAPWRPYEPQ